MQSFTTYFVEMMKYQRIAFTQSDNIENQEIL